MRSVVVIAVALVALTPGAARAAQHLGVSPLTVDIELLAQAAALLGDAPWDGFEIERAQAQTGRTDERDRASSSSSDQGQAQPSGAASYAPAGAYSTPQGRQFGIGLQLGYPVALIIKYMLQANQGIAAGIGAFSGFIYDRGSVTIFVDYLYHPHLITAGEAFALTWYVGGGAQVIINDRFSAPYVRGVLYPGFNYGSQFWLAGRVPLGLNLALAQAPIEVFLEATPSILLFPALSFGIGGSIGVRFYL